MIPLNVIACLLYNRGMGRARRVINDNGELWCKVCERWRHISTYRTREVIPGFTRIEDIWYEENGKEYGRPDGYCKPCSSKKAQGHVVLTAYLSKIAAEKYADDLEVKRRSHEAMVKAVEGFDEMVRRSLEEDKEVAMELSRIREGN